MSISTQFQRMGLAVCGLILTTLLRPLLLSAAPGDEHWDPRFGGPGTTNYVFALSWNEGRLYAGGVYSQPPGVTNSHVDVWDGSRWAALPGLESGLVVVWDFAWMD